MSDRFGLPGIFVNVTHVPKYPGRERRELTLAEFGTVAFDREVMLNGIHSGRIREDVNGHMELDSRGQPIFDPAPQLDVTLWFLMVPECYRGQVWRGVEAVFPRVDKCKLDDHARRRFVEELREWLMYNLEPVR